MKNQIFERLIEFLNDLEQRKLSYTLEHNRDEAIMILIAIPGERWEVEFLSDGSVEVEKFISSGEIHDESTLAELLAEALRENDRAHDAPPEVKQATLATG